MKIAKFGGSSLASAEQVRKVCDIVSSDPTRRLVVVSAPGKRDDDDIKVTDLLIAAAEATLVNRSGEGEMQRVVNRFAELVDGLGMGEKALAPIREDLQTRLHGGTEDEGLFMDTLKAAGEDNCARLVAQYLRSQGVEAHYADPGKVGMILSEEAGKARVLKASYGKLRSLRDRPGITILPGFFGFTRTGKLVTFPRGGSDITGAILAAAVDAELYENFSDVDSVFAANPKLVDSPRAVQEITYREMRELSYAGFSVIHDEALQPVFHAGIPVAVKNTNNPAASGTLIVPNRTVGDDPVVGIAANGGFCSVYVSKYLMNREVGFGRRLLEVFEDEAIPFEHTPSGIDNLSVILREEYFDHATEDRVLRRVRTELEADEVSVERGLALVMVVGEGMRHTIGLAGKAATAFADAGVNLEMINQGSSEVSMMFGVKEEDAKAAVGSLYNAFFP
ncbi:MAG: aspartate kinase [Candidatus Latescibacterota bacterium]|nr:aspartate kinase [Candidatus Latescibacterota bacterium]